MEQIRARVPICLELEERKTTQAREGVSDTRQRRTHTDAGGGRESERERERESSTHTHLKDDERMAGC